MQNVQAIGDMEKARDMKVAAVAPVEPQHIISHPYLIRTLDLNTLTLEQTELTQAFELDMLAGQVGLDVPVRSQTFCSLRTLQDGTLQEASK